MTNIMVKVYKDKKEAMTFRKLALKNSFKAEVIKLRYPKGQCLLYASGG